MIYVYLNANEVPCGLEKRPSHEIDAQTTKKPPGNLAAFKSDICENVGLFDHLSDQIMIRRVGDLQLDNITDIRLPGSYVDHAVDIRRLL